MADINDWVVEGVQVFTDHRGFLNVARIAKVTKRVIVMEDGTRFSRATLSRPLGSCDAVLLRSMTNLVTVSEPRVQRAGQTATAAATILRKFFGRPTETQLADAVVAIEKWRAAARAEIGE